MFIQACERQNYKSTFRPHLHLGSCKAIILQATLIQKHTVALLYIHIPAQKHITFQDGYKECCPSGVSLHKREGGRGKGQLFLHQQTSSNVVLTHTHTQKKCNRTAESGVCKQQIMNKAVSTVNRHAHKLSLSLGMLYST